MKYRTHLLCTAMMLLLACSGATQKKSAQGTDGPEVSEQAPIHNYLEGSTWKLDRALFGSQTTTEYALTPPTKAGERFSYGQHICFGDATHFRAYYTAPCGNDCFRTVEGTYALLSETELLFCVDSVTFDGECSPNDWPGKPTDGWKGYQARFSITRNDSLNSWHLKKL